VAPYRATALIAVLLAVTSRVVIAMPAFTVDEIRAATCCTKDCPGAGTPHRCCEYRREAGDPAAVAAKATPPGFVAGVVAVLPDLFWGSTAPSPQVPPSERSTGPPRFLQLGVLRL
jgi:hypothetical protein